MKIRLNKLTKNNIYSETRKVEATLILKCSTLNRSSYKNNQMVILCYKMKHM